MKKEEQLLLSTYFDNDEKSGPKFQPFDIRQAIGKPNESTYRGIDKFYILSPPIHPYIST